MRTAALLALLLTGALVAAAGASAAPLIAEYAGTSIPTDAKPTDVVVAPDGNQWYTFPGRDSIARVTPSGEVQEVTAGISSGAAPRNARGTGTTRSIRLKAKAPRRRR
jgi:streptogramin lyase